MNKDHDLYDSIYHHSDSSKPEHCSCEKKYRSRRCFHFNCNSKYVPDCCAEIFCSLACFLASGLTALWEMLQRYKNEPGKLRKKINNIRYRRSELGKMTRSRESDKYREKLKHKKKDEQSAVPEVTQTEPVSQTPEMIQVDTAQEISTPDRTMKTDNTVKKPSIPTDLLGLVRESDLMQTIMEDDQEEIEDMIANDFVASSGPKCKRPGCPNGIGGGGQRYCSKKCRKAFRNTYAQLLAEYQATRCAAVFLALNLLKLL